MKLKYGVNQKEYDAIKEVAAKFGFDFDKHVVNGAAAKSQYPITTVVNKQEGLGAILIIEYDVNFVTAVLEVIGNHADEIKAIGSAIKNLVKMCGGIKSELKTAVVAAKTKSLLKL